MELMRLRYFYTVGKMLNISQAAKIHGIPQPAMSKTISSLESELGVKLFDRSKNHLSLTKAGQLFMPEVEKALEHLDEEFASVRAGRANAKVLDRITVEYYGSETPLNGVATISTPDARTLIIQPWDTKLLKDIQRAIQTSDLGINPQNDGKCIRLAFPQLTEERRKELVKQIHKYAENGKVAVRNIRRDAMDNFKKQQKASEITEDELKIAEKDLQKLTDDSCKEIDKILDNKEKELMSV